MCKSGKVKHSKFGAQVLLRKLKNKGMNIYRCRDCGGWHLGNSNQDFRRQQRIDQLLGKPAAPSRCGVLTAGTSGSGTSGSRRSDDRAAG